MFQTPRDESSAATGRQATQSRCAVGALAGPDSDKSAAGVGTADNLEGEKIGRAAKAAFSTHLPMSPTFYHIIHVLSVLVLTGYTFYAFAAPAETRKTVVIITGIASLLVLVGGFGLQAKLALGWPGWLMVKVVCWLGFSALAGIGYRRRGAAGTLAMIAVALVAVAVVMVYARPF